MATETPPVKDLTRFYKGLAYKYSTSKTQPKKFKEYKNYTYEYTKHGNLEMRTLAGKKELRLKLPDYRKPTFEEIEEAEQERSQAISIAQKEFNEAREVLRQAILGDDLTPQERVILNSKVQEADDKLQLVRFPLREIVTIPSIDQNRIILDDPYETRKLNNVLLFTARPFTLETQYTRIGIQEPEEPMETKKTVELKRKKRPTILFKSPATNEYGFMSLEWPVIFEFRETTYKSAKHALLGELAKEFDDDAMFERIQSIEDPNALTFTFEDYTDVTEEAWDSKRGVLIQEIIREKFRQNPELAEQLLQTKRARLGADILGDLLFGIGLSIENPLAADYKKWTGQNLLGLALEDIRSELKEERRAQEAEEAVGEGAPLVDTEGVVETAGELAEGVGELAGDAVDAVGETTTAVAETVAETAKTAVDVAQSAVSAVARALSPQPQAPPPQPIVKKLRIVKPSATTST
jgi:ribA/ribD-fused uncharacterized protein